MNTTETRRPTDADVADAIARGKREITEDILAGRVPATVTTFGELHDFVDANEYGGLCEEGPIEWIDWDDEVPADRGAKVQNALHEWLGSGRGTYGNVVHGATEILVDEADEIVGDIPTDSGVQSYALAGGYLVNSDDDGVVAVHLVRAAEYDSGSTLGDELRATVSGDWGAEFARYLDVDEADEWVDLAWIGTAAYRCEFAENVILA